MLGKRILPSCVIIFRREFSSSIKANFCDRFFEHNLTSFSAADSAISFACIQVKENSLKEYTANDAVIE